jgi:hypothetical protein
MNETTYIVIIIILLAFLIVSVIGNFYLYTRQRDQSTVEKQLDEAAWAKLRGVPEPLTFMDLQKLWERLVKGKNSNKRYAFIEGGSATMVGIFSEKVKTWMEFLTFLNTYKNFKDDKKIDDEVKKVGFEIFCNIASKKDYKTLEYAQILIAGIESTELMQRGEDIMRLKSFLADSADYLKWFNHTNSYLQEKVAGYAAPTELVTEKEEVETKTEKIAS